MALWGARVPVTVCGSASAQEVQGSLVDLVNSGRYDFNRLERQAAIANQAAYNELAPLCQDSGAGARGQLQRQPEPFIRECSRAGANGQRVAGRRSHLQQPGTGRGRPGGCAALDGGRGTGRAKLRRPQFANNQLTSLMSRMTALRYGARGFSVVNAPRALVRTTRFWRTSRAPDRAAAHRPIQYRSTSAAGAVFSMAPMAGATAIPPTWKMRSISTAWKRPSEPIIGSRRGWCWAPSSVIPSRNRFLTHDAVSSMAVSKPMATARSCTGCRNGTARM